MTVASRLDMILFLDRARAGDALLRRGLVAQNYAELGRVAVGLMRQEHPDHMLSPMATFHEAMNRVLANSAVDRAGYRSDLFAAALEVAVGTVARGWRIARARPNNVLGAEGIG